uniref:Reverse transcriptase zinc-binding domain-containing protein n=1 Tax=Cannabis sativa TaxID=3483 RepID=A0A803NZ16_CANSA
MARGSTLRPLLPTLGVTKVAELLLDNGDWDIPKLRTLFDSDTICSGLVWNKLWNSKILERHKVLWWCILSDDLPIRALLTQRMSIKEISCSLCGGGARVWDQVTFLWNLKSKGVDTDKLFLNALIVIDTIWMTRNEKGSAKFGQYNQDMIFCKTDKD